MIEVNKNIIYKVKKRHVILNEGVIINEKIKCEKFILFSRVRIYDKNETIFHNKYVLIIIIKLIISNYRLILL